MESTDNSMTLLNMELLTDVALMEGLELNREENPTLDAMAFPEKPLLERTDRHLRIEWQGRDIAETNNAYWVLQTHKPPSTFVLPLDFTLHLTPLEGRKKL